MKWLSALFAVVLFACHPAYASIEDTRDQTVYIMTFSKEGRMVSGAGTIISDWQIVTAAHVLLDDRVHYARFANGESRKLTVEWIDRSNDIAIVTTSVPEEYSGAKVNCDKIKVGKPIYTWGHPFGIRWTYSEGSVANRDNPLLGETILLDLTVYLGSSGGGVFNDKDELVGVIHALVTEQPGFSTMIPVSYACPHL